MRAYEDIKYKLQYLESITQLLSCEHNLLLILCNNELPGEVEWSHSDWI